MEAAAGSNAATPQLSLEILLILAEISAVRSEYYDTSARWLQVSNVFRRNSLFRKRLVQFWASQDVGHKRYPHFALGAAIAGHVDVFGEILKTYHDYQYDDEDKKRTVFQRIPIRVVACDKAGAPSIAASQPNGALRNDPGTLDGNVKLQFPCFRTKEDENAFLACYRNAIATNSTASPKLSLLDVLCVLCREDRFLPAIRQDDDTNCNIPALTMIEMCMSLSHETSLSGPVSRLTYKNLCSSPINPSRLLLDRLWDYHYCDLVSKTNTVTATLATKLTVSTCLHTWLPMVFSDPPRGVTPKCPLDALDWKKIIDWLFTSPGLRDQAPLSVFRRATAANNRAVLSYVLDHHADKFNAQDLHAIRARVLTLEIDQKVMFREDEKNQKSPLSDESTSESRISQQSENEDFDYGDYGENDDNYDADIPPLIAVRDRSPLLSSIGRLLKNIIYPAF